MQYFLGHLVSFTGVPGGKSASFTQKLMNFDENIFPATYFLLNSGFRLSIAKVIFLSFSALLRIRIHQIRIKFMGRSESVSNDADPDPTKTNTGIKQKISPNLEQSFCIDIICMIIY